MQAHPGLLGRTSALPPVARHAAGDDVLPVLATALRNRNDVVEGEVGGGERVTAVLAPMPVARVDVRAREGHVVDSAFDADEPQQADHRRQPEADRNRVHLAVVDRDQPRPSPGRTSVRALRQWTTFSGSYVALSRSVCSMPQYSEGSPPALSRKRHPKTRSNRASFARYSPPRYAGGFWRRRYGPIHRGHERACTHGHRARRGHLDGLGVRVDRRQAAALPHPSRAPGVARPPSIP